MAFNYGGYPPYGTGYNMAQPYQNQMMMQPTSQMPISAPQTASQPAQGISPVSRPVSNREEAVAAQIPFDGSISVFPDITHNRVYIKRWNMQTGASDFGEFAPVSPANADQNSEQASTAFVSLEDFQNLQGTVGNLQREIERMKKSTSNGKAGKKNDAADE